MLKLILAYRSHWELPHFFLPLGILIKGAINQETGSLHTTHGHNTIDLVLEPMFASDVYSSHPEAEAPMPGVCICTTVSFTFDPITVFKFLHQSMSNGQNAHI